MSKKIYDYDKCFELAKLCSCSSEMRKMNMSAYNVAVRHKWIDDYVWFKVKHHKPYTYDEVYEIAKSYTCSSDFQKGNGSAYSKARAKGWIKDYFWFTVKQHTPYTYQECYDVAKEYKSRHGLALGNIGVYQAALNHGWLDDYTWFESRQRPSKYWTKERVEEESKKYKTRGDFALGNGSAYGKARINNWLEEYTWLKDDRIDLVEGKIDCVYAYEFIEYNTVYVGRTLMRRVAERNYEHLFTEKDVVAQFVREHRISLPDMVILEENLTLNDGIEKEGYYLRYYKENGWKTLNRAKTGSIGKLAKDKWTKETCYREARKYKTRGEFAEHNGSAYDSARRNGWLVEYSWFKELQRPAGYWYDFDNCYQAALKCRNKTEFLKKYSRAYFVARQNDWMKHFTWFNIKRKAHNKKWDHDSVIEEAKKYKTKKDFRRNANGAYKVALHNKWLEECIWFEDTTTLRSRSLTESWISRKKWGYDICKGIAETSSDRLDMKKKCIGAYSASLKRGWLDEFFPMDKN